MDMQERRKAAAMMTLATMRSEIDRLPAPDRDEVMKFVEQLREKAKNPKFDAAMKIVVVEMQLGQTMND